MIKKSIFYLFVLILLVISGCASIREATSIVPEDINFQADQREFVFKKIDAEGNPVSDKEIISSIADAMSKQSNFKRVGDYGTSTPGIRDRKGIKISTTTPGKILVSYINGEYYTKTGRLYATSINAEFNLAISEDNENKKVAFSPPAKIVLKKERSPLLLPISQLAPTEKIVTDLAKIASSISPKIKYGKKIDSEVNVDFDDSSVFANFNRLLGSYNWRSETERKKYDLEKSKLFNLGEGDKRIPVDVSVFPYRNGSKVVYKFVYTYELDGNGGTTYDQGELDGLIAKVESVAKD